MSARSAQPKGDTDRRDLKMLLLSRPELKTEFGSVMDRLIAAGASASAIAEWATLVMSEIESETDDEGY